MRLDRCLVGLLCCAWPLISLAGNAPFLLTLSPQTAVSARASGYIPVVIDESVALEATTKGSGFWVPLPAGAVHLSFESRVVHPDGAWTWIGTASDAPRAPKAVITFGDHAAFGTIPTPSGKTWSITSLSGKTWLVDPAASMHGLPPNHAVTQVRDRGMHAAEAQAMRASDGSESNEATADSPATVDLLVLYTPGFRNQYGSDTVALVRINHQVDLLNQAFKDSQVYGRVRLVHAAEVAYPDTTDDTDALSDLRHGVAPLDDVPAMRSKYGADEVVLMRAFIPGSDSCSSTVIMGYNLAPITGADAVRAFAILDDAADPAADQACFHIPGYGLTEILGSNYGLRNQNTENTPGPYPFSYAYQAAPLGGACPKGTLKADGCLDSTWPVFSNPNINLCDGGPCGVPGQSDAARSLNLTLPTIAMFEPTRVPVAGFPVQDVNGDDKSDLLWMNPKSSTFGYWTMNGPSVSGLWSKTIASGYRVAATGDFNGDGLADVIWTSVADDLYLWSSNGSGFDAKYVGTYSAGDAIVGTGDVGGDGKVDLLWVNADTDTFGYWVMDGATVIRKWSTPISAGYSITAIGDFNGDGRADVVWTSAKRDLYLWESNGVDFDAYYMGTYPSGWTVAGAGDVNGDGRSDLLWRNQGAGLFGYWIMNGATQVSGQAIPAAGNYNIAAIGDFNGDGKVDLMWTSTKNDLYLWTSNGTGYDAAYVGTYPAGWSVIPSQLMAAWGHP